MFATMGIINFSKQVEEVGYLLRKSSMNRVT